MPGLVDVGLTGLLRIAESFFYADFAGFILKKFILIVITSNFMVKISKKKNQELFFVI